MFSHVPVHFAILLGFSICLGGGGAGGGDASRRLAAGFFAAGFFGGGGSGPRNCVVPLLMFVMRKAGAFFAAGLRLGHCGGPPGPVLRPPPNMSFLSMQVLHISFSQHSACSKRQLLAQKTGCAVHFQAC